MYPILKILIYGWTITCVIAFLLLHMNFAELIPGIKSGSVSYIGTIITAHQFETSIWLFVWAVPTILLYSVYWLIKPKMPDMERTPQDSHKHRQQTDSHDRPASLPSAASYNPSLPSAAVRFVCKRCGEPNLKGSGACEKCGGTVFYN